jgi:GT2 family glycosyltransferase
LDYENFKINIIDNGSQDGSPQWVAKSYPEINLWSFSKNRGFSWAFNWGVNHTQSDLVLSLNPDVYVRQDFLRELVKTITEEEKVGMVAPKLLQFDDPKYLDSTGLFINYYRRPFDRGQGEIDNNQYDLSLQVFGVCGAAALYRRTMLSDVKLDNEYFDEDFFSYYEDVDLAWRAQMRGWYGKFSPDAVATHVRGLGDTLRKRKDIYNESNGPRFALRNRYLMIIKNDSLKHFLLDLPLILIAELPRLIYVALFAPSVIQGLFDVVIGFRPALKKRRQIRKSRIVNDKTLRQWFKPQSIHSPHSG